jgi:small-conductance mechanosensitive channel
MISMGARIAGLVFLATFIANALGYVSIASLVGNTLLSSAYIAVVFYVAVRIADGLIMFASRVRPLRLLGMVHRHRSMLRRRIRRVLQWLAIIGWFVLTLDSLSLRGPVIDRVRAILTADLTIGALSVSLGDVLVFALTVWAAFLLSRFIRFLLEEDVYPRAGLARGVPYAISTMLHYVILLVGFFVAIAAMGFDMTKFTILAGAFGVGLGFGMQNIVNNFVSGLILLFERPVKVGDVIQLEDTGGAVESLGIRASLIRTWDSSEIIVPNSKLISERVTNWT